MRRDDGLFQNCVEPEFQYAEGPNSTYFPPIIALYKTHGAASDAIERQLWHNWSSYPANVKEDIILEDLMNVLCGSDGTFFSIERCSYKVKCSPILDKKQDGTLCMMATEILELAVMQRKVQDFIYNNEQGFVVLSLCEVLNVLLQELQSRIVQFDDSQVKGAVGLQRFKLYLQPALQTFEVLTMIVSHGVTTGSSLINLLASINNMFGTGDARRGLANHLMKQAIESYCCLIDPWIHFGQLYDPCQEFFVIPKRTQITQKETREFAIEWVRVPEIMKDIAQTILDTGFYVRLLSDSKRKLVLENQHLQAGSVEELKEKVVAVHQVVSVELMKFIVFECNLMDVLVSMHRFYLVSQGDYISNLLADSDSKEPYGSIELRFQEAVSHSSLRNDDYRNNYTMEPYNYQVAMDKSIANALEGARPPTLLFKIEWPLILFFSESVMSMYRLVFGFLLQLKQVMYTLNRIWLAHMKWKRLALTPTSQLRLNFTFVIIERMLFLCRNIEYLCTIEVSERNFNLMLQSYEASLKNTKGQQAFNFITNEHEEFMQKVVEQCLLTDHVVFPCLQRGLSICNVFATRVLSFLEQWEQDSAYCTKGTRSSRLDRATQCTNELLQNPGYVAMIGTASKQFEKHVSALVASLEEAGQQSASLFLRLTYNGFFR